MSKLIIGKNARRCTQCKIVKSFDNFRKQENGKYGYQSWCKPCHREAQREWYKNNKERHLENSRENYYNNREEKLEQKKKYYNKNKKRISKQRQKRYKLNREHELKINRKWYDNNKEKVIKYTNEYKKQRRKNNPEIRLLFNLRCYLSSIKKNKINGSLKDYLGCEPEKAKKWIESQWESGMSWENYGRGKGKWHIDHFIPISALDMTNNDHLEIVWNYSNLRPLWAEDNWSKQQYIEGFENLEIDNSLISVYNNV